MHIKTPFWQECRVVPGLNETQFWKNYALLLKDRMNEVRWFDRNIRFDEPKPIENEFIFQLACRYSKKVSWQSCAIIYAPEHKDLAVKLAQYTERRLKHLGNWKEPELTQGMPTSGVVWMPFVLSAENALLAAQYLISDAQAVADLLCEYLAQNPKTRQVSAQSQTAPDQQSRPNRSGNKSAKPLPAEQTHPVAPTSDASL